MQGNDSYRLVVRRGPQPNQTYELNKDIITVGRDITNDISINDPEVSRHHMRLTRGAGGYTIEDLGSTNGTFLNGQRLTGAKPLNSGDNIGLGETVTLGYELMRAQPGAAPVGPDLAPTAASPMPRSMQPPYAAPAEPPAYAAPGQPAAPYVPPAGPAAPAPYVPPAQQSAAPSPFAYSPEPAYAQGQPPQAPAVPGYEYDPYAAREEEGRNTTRWVVIGCAGITLLCCCGTAVGLFLVDSLCLWNRLPIIWDILRALGYTVTC